MPHLPNGRWAWPTRRESERDARQRKEAWDRATSLPDCFERRVLLNMALPYHEPPVPSGAQLNIIYLPSIDEYYVYSSYARTIVKSIADVAFFLKAEARHPGHLEEFLTGRNRKRELDEALERARLQVNRPFVTSSLKLEDL